MTDAGTSSSPRALLGVARALVAAARSRALYPPEHPAVGASLARLQSALDEATAAAPLAIGIAPDSLVADDGAPLADGVAAEAAALLHDRDLLRVVFAPGLTPAAVNDFVDLIAADAATLRARGGPAEAWRVAGHACIAVTQVDYARVLQDRGPGPQAARRDDVWQRIVRSVLDPQKVLDETVQRRLVEIAGDAGAIGELAREVMAPHCMPDGSPMVTRQAAAVLDAYHDLYNIVALLAPEKREEMYRNLADATAALDPRVVMQILRSGLDHSSGVELTSTAAVIRGIASHFDDAKVAELVAKTLALEGRASGGLVEAFDTIAPDAERRERVLRLTRSLLSETDFGRRDEFPSLWQSAEELLMTYNERPFVSAQYRAGLDAAGERAARMAAAGLPAEIGEWMQTLDQESVRRFSVQLLIDLLKLEDDPARAGDIAGDLAAMAEDLLLAGDFEAAADIAVAMRGRAEDRAAATREACRLALDGLGESLAVFEAVAGLEEMDDTALAHVRRFAEAVGPSIVGMLTEPITFEDGRSPRARTRASQIIISFGPLAVLRLSGLVGSPRWHVQRNACELLEAIASAEAVPLLQPLLRSQDPRIVRAAVKALSNIDDPLAARAMHTVLRACTGEARRAVVAALTDEKDPRVVPVLMRILDESDSLGPDHGLVLETLVALGSLGPVVTDGAVGTVAALMRRRKWFARRKVRALTETAVTTLRRLNTPAAAAALNDAAARGDRLLRRVAGRN